MKLYGKTALITGGAKGIGYATALRLADAGCSLMLWDIDQEALAEAQAELTARAALQTASHTASHREPQAGAAVIHIDTCDVGDPEAVAAAADRARSALGRIDILINNAGYMAPGYFTDQDLAAWHRTININLNAVLSLTHAFLPDMYRRDFGRVINISSAAGLVGVPGLAVYSAAKWAVFGLTEALRAEARTLGKDVRYSSIHPMFLASGMFAGAELNFFGKMLFPRVSGHDVIAKAIVEDALKRGARCPKRPRRLRLVPLLRGLLPDAALSALGRLMGLHRSMDGWTGRTSSGTPDTSPVGHSPAAPNKEAGND